MELAETLAAYVVEARTKDPQVMATKVGSSDELHALAHFIAVRDLRLAPKFVSWCKKRQQHLRSLVTANGVHLVRRRTVISLP